MNTHDSMRRRALRLHPCAAAIALVLALPAAAATRSVAAAPAPHQPASIVVGNCNDSGPGSLRDAIAGAASGDMIDLSNLNCSTITLSSGQIEIPQNDLYIKYSGEHGTPPTISANLSSRVFHHTGTGTLRLVGLTISEGKYDDTNAAFPSGASGGCIYSYGSVYLLGSTLTGCVAKDSLGDDARGGGIYARQLVTLKHSVVSGNSATSTMRFASGGGVFTRGAIDVEYSSVSGNTAYGQGYLNFGGGITIINFGTTASLVEYSTIDGNRGASRGGGLFVSGGGSSGTAISIFDSTISGNTTSNYAAAAYFRGPVTLASSTIAFNQGGPAGPAVELASHTDRVEFNSSILARNTRSGGEYDLGSQGYTITISGANNLIMSANGPIPPPDTISADPLLLPLADNGGQTRTHALDAGSPAIDHGNDAALLGNDQRGNGYPRVFGTAADIGAYESQSVDDTIFANGFEL